MQLKRLIFEMRPNEVDHDLYERAYETSSKAFTGIAQVVKCTLFAQAIFPPDSKKKQCLLVSGSLSNLLTSSNIRPNNSCEDLCTDLPGCYSETYLNLGLLMNVLARTDDESLKKVIRFLAMNYLCKATDHYSLITQITGFARCSGDKEDKELLKTLFRDIQLGIITNILYHRESRTYEDTAKISETSWNY